jgi:acyl carrier protein
MNKDLVPLIAQILHELNGKQDTGSSPDIDGQTRLYGPDGILDSLGIVTLVVALEQAIEDTYGVSISLADEKALSQRHSPYRTVGTLSQYAASLLEESPSHG